MWKSHYGCNMKIYI